MIPSALVWILAIVFLTMLVGLFLIPGIAFALGKVLKLEALTGILLTIGQLCTDNGHVLLQHPDGSYRQHVVRPAPDDASHDAAAEYLDDDDEWQPLKTESRWTRLGKRPFGISFGPSEKLFRGAAAPLEDVEQNLQTDGGLTTRERAGTTEWIPAELLARLRERGGWFVRTAPFRAGLHGEGGSAGAEQAKRRAKAKYGGANKFSNKMIVIGGFLFFTTGAVMAFLMFGF